MKALSFLGIASSPVSDCPVEDFCSCGPGQQSCTWLKEKQAGVQHSTVLMVLVSQQQRDSKGPQLETATESLRTPPGRFHFYGYPRKMDIFMDGYPLVN